MLLIYFILPSKFGFKMNENTGDIERDTRKK